MNASQGLFLSHKPMALVNKKSNFAIQKIKEKQVNLLCFVMFLPSPNLKMQITEVTKKDLIECKHD